MLAIAKPTLSRQPFDVLEIGLEIFVRFPQLKSPHTGGVHDRAALRSQEQLPMRRSVAPAIVVSADFLGCLHRFAEELVGQGRLADAR